MRHSGRHLLAISVLTTLAWLFPIPGSAQTDPDVPPDHDPDLAGALPDSAQLGSLTALADSALTSGQIVAEPAEGVLEIEEVDLWSTGVSPTRAVLMTPVFPGWGQLYTGGSWRGTLAFGAEMYFWANLLTRDRRAVRNRDFAHTFPEGDPNRDFYDANAEENWEQMRDFAWWSGGVLLIIALDAYVGAHLFNFDEDPVPVPNAWDEQFGDVGGDMPGAARQPTYVVFQWQKKF